MSYTSSALVEQFLGVQLSIAQKAEADTEAAAASAYIDRKTARSWATTGTITAEQHTLLGPVLYLRQPPVSSISSATMRWQWAGSPTDTLVASADYELTDPALGIVVFRRSYDLVTGLADLDMIRDDVYGRLDRIVSVTYVSTATVPADIQRVATLLVAAGLWDNLNPDYAGFRSVFVTGVGVQTVDVERWRNEAETIIRARRALVFA